MSTDTPLTDALERGGATTYLKMREHASELERRLSALQSEREREARDAAKWREHAEVVRMSARENTLLIQLTAHAYGDVHEIKAVLTLEQLGRGVLGLKAVGLSAEHQAEKLFAAIDAALKARHD